MQSGGFGPNEPELDHILPELDQSSAKFGLISNRIGRRLLLGKVRPRFDQMGLISFKCGLNSTLVRLRVGFDYSAAGIDQIRPTFNQIGVAFRDVRAGFGQTRAREQGALGRHGVLGKTDTSGGVSSRPSLVGRSCHWLPAAIRPRSLCASPGCPLASRVSAPVTRSLGGSDPSLPPCLNRNGDKLRALRVSRQISGLGQRRHCLGDAHDAGGGSQIVELVRGPWPCEGISGSTL